MDYERLRDDLKRVADADELIEDLDQIKEIRVEMKDGSVIYLDDPSLVDCMKAFLKDGLLEYRETIKGGLIDELE